MPPVRIRKTKLFNVLSANLLPALPGKSRLGDTQHADRTALRVVVADVAQGQVITVGLGSRSETKVFDIRHICRHGYQRDDDFLVYTLGLPKA